MVFSSKERHRVSYPAEFHTQLSFYSKIRRTMHILIIPGWYPNHQSESVSIFRRQAIALVKAGHQVGLIYPAIRSLREWKTVITGDYGFESGDDAGVATIRWHGMGWFPKIHALNRLYWIFVGKKLFKRYSKLHGNPQIVHAHSMLNAGLLAHEIFRLHKIPYVITEHQFAYSENVLSRLKLQLSSRACEFAAALLGVSPGQAESLSRALPGQTNWKYVPNLVTEDFFALPVREISPLSKGFRFVSIGRLSPEKGFPLLLRAFSLAFKAQPEVTLVIGGGGSDQKKLERLIEELKIQSQVTLTGNLEEQRVLECLFEADAYVQASLAETFGIAIAEALAAGKPVVATKCEGPMNIVRDGDGILVPINDVKSLAQAMASMTSDLRKYDPYLIRHQCAQRFSAEAVCSQLSTIYSSVVDNNLKS